MNTKLFIKKFINTLLSKLGYCILRIDKIKFNKFLLSGSDDYLYQDFSKDTLLQRSFYNIGAGGFYHKYWTNIDYDPVWNIKSKKPNFVNCNLVECKPLPFPDEQAELIYTSHTIEHVPDEASANLFKESFRILRKGGGIRISCPDAEIFYDTLVRKDILYWDWRTDWYDFVDRLNEVTIFDFLLREIATPRCRFYRFRKPDIILTPESVQGLFSSLGYEEFMDAICSKCTFDSNHTGDHINWWDEGKVKRFLNKAGFKEVYKSRFGQSKFPPLRNTKYFDNTFPNMSLYVEAIKE